MRENVHRDSSEDYEAGVAAAYAIWHNCADSNFVWPEDLGTAEFAAGALEEYGRLQRRDMRGMAGKIAKGARKGAEQLNTDRWHGLIEVVQNADDLGASEVALLLDEEQRLLHMRHNGERVRIEHVLAMTYAFVSTKTEDPRATGRFGVGLKTLGQLGTTLDVHCGVWSFRVHDCHTTPTTLSEGLDDFFSLESGDTLITLHLSPKLDLSQMAAFCDTLSDSLTLFLKSVATINIETDSKKWAFGYNHGEAEIYAPGIILYRLRDDDNNELLRFERTVAVPDGLERTDKATGVETTIGFALGDGVDGGIYVTLPTLIKTEVKFALNADFDPVSNREALRNVTWNEWLLKELGNLVSDVLIRMFLLEPASAWRPVPFANEAKTANPWLQQQLELLQKDVFTRLQEEGALIVDGRPVPFSGISFADEVVEGLLEASDPELVYTGTVVMPPAACDDDCWQIVLKELGGREVGLDEAFTLFDLPETEMRGEGWYASLCLKALDEGRSDLLTLHPCLKLEMGRTRAMARQLATAWVTHGGADDPLKRLGLTRRLSPGYQTLTEWPKLEAALINDFNYRRTILEKDQLEALASRNEPVHLTGVELLQVKKMMENCGDSSIGRRLGRVIEIDAYCFKHGKKSNGVALVGDCYLPAVIAKDRSGGWAQLCNGISGLWWAAPSLGLTLKGSKRGRKLLVNSDGLKFGERGPRSFLQQLGAEIAPRLKPPSGSYKMAAEQIKALPAVSGPITLVQDLVCPDLELVLDVIGSRTKKLRMSASQDLFRILAYSWDRLYAPRATAVAEVVNKKMTYKYTIPATWLCLLKERSWLFSASKKEVSPVGLAIATAINRSIYGNEPDRLALGLTEADAAGSMPQALGMLVDPDAGEILKQLAALRLRDSTEWALSGTVLMRALADRCSILRSVSATATVDGLTVQELRDQFRRQLIYLPKQNRFASADELLYGVDIFHGRRLFVPKGGKLDPLWKVLKIKEPDGNDCIDVIEELAIEPSSVEGSQAAALEALQLLAREVLTADDNLKFKLARLPLWNGRRFVRSRPAFVTASPEVAAALEESVTVWRAPFDPLARPELLAALKVRPVGAESISVAPGCCSQASEEFYRRFARAVGLMKGRLATEDSRCYRSVDWDRLEGANLLLGSELTLQVKLVVGRDRSFELEVPARCHLDTLERVVIYLADESALAGFEEGGRLVASLFAAEHRLQVSSLWFWAWQAAGHGTEAAAVIELAREESNADDDDSLEKLAEKTVGKKKKVKKEAKGQAGAGGENKKPVPEPALQLKDPDWLMTTGVEVEHADNGGGGEKSKKGRGLKGELPKPDKKNNGGTGGGRLRAFTNEQLESAGYRALEHLFSHGEDAELMDFRQQRGIGSDAVLDREALRTWFELKASAGDPPASLTLTSNEFERARKEGANFCLAVVSGLAVGFDTVVRIYPDPLNRLDWAPSSSVTVSGIGSRKALVCRLDGE